MEQGAATETPPVTAEYRGDHHYAQTSSMTMSGDAKVADVAAKLTEKIPVNRGSMNRAFEWYHSTYIKPGRFMPVVHMMLLVGTIGYAIEYPHIKHELEEARKAAEKIE